MLYNSLTEFGLTMNVVMLIKICSNENYSGAHTGKNTCYVYDNIQNGLKKAEFFLH
jgi:hypothetical protein